MNLLDRFKRGWNVFRAEEEKVERENFGAYSGGYSSHRPDRPRLQGVSRKSILGSIINRIGVDYSNVAIRHVRLDDNRRYLSDEKSDLNECLTVEPNLDQEPSHFRRDIGMTMLHEGVVALVPVETDTDPEDTEAYTIKSLRAGVVTAWFPRKVRVRLYNADYGIYQEVTVPKSYVAIVENPFYDIMNEPNSTMTRLSRKIALMDYVDEQIGSGKLDLIIQLPYMVKTDSKRAQAEKRRSELEEQLGSSQLGVAYTDGTERVIQLNRPVENNLMKNVDSLTNLLYDQLGITAEILNGTASEQVMLNYQNRIIKPMLDVTVESMRRKFLSKTARTKGQSIEYFQDPFALTPVSTLAELGDKLTRNAIVSTNEFRQIIGMKPVLDDPVADKLINKNLPAPVEPEAKEE